MVLNVPRTNILVINLIILSNILELSEDLFSRLLEDTIEGVKSTPVR